jgi:DNA-binding IclR family transcriptional regulator
LGAGALQAYSRRTITTLDKLVKALALSRADGYTADDGEFLEEIRCVAAPIRDQGGTVVASIGISAPSTRFPKSRWPLAARQVMDTARAISATLGG